MALVLSAVALEKKPIPQPQWGAHFAQRLDYLATLPIYRGHNVRGCTLVEFYIERQGRQSSLHPLNCF